MSPGKMARVTISHFFRHPCSICMSEIKEPGVTACSGKSKFIIFTIRGIQTRKRERRRKRLNALYRPNNYVLELYSKKLFLFLAAFLKRNCRRKKVKPAAISFSKRSQWFPNPHLFWNLPEVKSYVATVLFLD